QQLGLVDLRGSARPSAPVTAEAPDMAEDGHGQRHIGDDHPQARFEYCRRGHDRSPVTSLSGMKVCGPPAERPPRAGAAEPSPATFGAAAIAAVISAALGGASP